MLGVAILIIVMSVMNGFRTDLTNKILGFNPHIIVKPYSSPINKDFKSLIKERYPNFKTQMTYSGEGVVIINDLAKGILIKGISNNNINNNRFIKKNIIDGDYKNFKGDSVLLGKELAINLGVVVGDYINLMSSAFIGTPFGGMPKQQMFKVSAIFSTGLYEFDQNIVFINLNNAISF